MEMTEMEQLVDLIKRSNIREITLRQGESRITLKQTLHQLDIGGELVPYLAEDGSFEEVDIAYAYTEAGSDQGVEVPPVPVTAPLVGVFHHTKPLVGLGANVKSGQVVAVIEAMKLFTEVTAPCDGVIVDTLIEDGMAAEYGQPLFLLKAG